MNALGYMLGSLGNPLVLNISKNPNGADNQQGSLSDPSETTRRASEVDEDIVRTSWRHGEVGRNDQPVSIGKLKK